MVNSEEDFIPTVCVISVKRIIWCVTQPTSRCCKKLALPVYLHSSLIYVRLANLRFLAAKTVTHPLKAKLRQKRSKALKTNIQNSIHERLGGGNHFLE